MSLSTHPFRMLCSRGSIVLMTILALGCITVNVYFPEAEIKELSESIEREVRERAASGESGASNDAWFSEEADTRRSLLSLLLAPSVAHAQGGVALPEVSSPAIRAIIESRAERLDDVLAQLDSGVLGEGKDGLLAVRDLASLELRDRAAVQKLLRDENKDREALFREIAVAKNVDLAQLPEIRATYAETLRDVAAPGTWIERPDGTWERK
ncbi:MAG: DUF1318 domain-containing protein [Acidobacteriota bacterium]